MADKVCYASWLSVVTWLKHSICVPFNFMLLAFNVTCRTMKCKTERRCTVVVVAEVRLLLLWISVMHYVMPLMCYMYCWPMKRLARVVCACRFKAVYNYTCINGPWRPEENPRTAVHVLIEFWLCQVPAWALVHCRISPSYFLAECCKRWLNKGSFVLL